MTSNGFYARHAETPCGATDLGIPLLLRAAATLEPASAALLLADLGSPSIPSPSPPADHLVRGRVTRRS